MPYLFIIILFDHASIRNQNSFAHNRGKSTTVTVKIRDFSNFYAAALFGKYSDSHLVMFLDFII